MKHYPLWLNGEYWDTETRLTVIDKISSAAWATVSQAGPRYAIEKMTEICLVAVTPEA